jgi:hypothetical protein
MTPLQVTSVLGASIAAILVGVLAVTGANVSRRRRALPL